ncbi:hypothetical protein [Thermococcus sp.]|nr:hypothetical protein [Thermococcus sp.]
MAGLMVIPLVLRRRRR